MKWQVFYQHRDPQYGWQWNRAVFSTLAEAEKEYSQLHNRQLETGSFRNILLMQVVKSDQEVIDAVNSLSAEQRAEVLAQLKKIVAK